MNPKKVVKELEKQLRKEPGNPVLRIRLAGALHAVGASYGVHKLIGDDPHWSIDGH